MPVISVITGMKRSLLFVNVVWRLSVDY